MGSHVELPGSRRPAKRDARKLRDVDPTAHIAVTITIKAPALPAVVPGKELDAHALAEAYAPAQGDLQTVERVLRSYGLTVEEVTGFGRSLKVSGSAANIEAAFRPSLAIYHSASQGDFRGREGSIQVPSELAGLVTGVFGLDQRRVAHRQTAHAADREAAAAGALAPLTPPQIEQRYDFPPGDGTGQVIAIAEFGTPEPNGVVATPAFIPSDVAAFCAKYGRNAQNVQVVPVNLSPLTLAQLQQLSPQQQEVAADETGEVMMDAEIVAALCPGATIQVYFATFDQKGWIDLLDQVTTAAQVPVSLSISWGEAEDSPDWSAGAVQAIDQRLQVAALRGITACISSGDDGSGDGMTDRRAHVDFPASSTNVLAVGGTMLTGVGAAAQEVTWWQSPGRRTTKGGGASGGGVSVTFPRPTWQGVNIPSINRGSIDGRVMPDVAALAGPPLFDLILAGQDAPNGGTSASAPLWASLIARVNSQLPAAKQQRFLTPLFYGPLPGGRPMWRDITVGQNASHPQPGKGYAAGIGFDAVTGFGVPIGTALVTNLSQV